MITDDMLIKERSHLGGVQRIYGLPNGFQLSLINAPMVHAEEFAWEAAVRDRGGKLVYDTPLTTDVEVFATDDEANAFIQRAKEWALSEAA